jgi:hypothetical protein
MTPLLTCLAISGIFRKKVAVVLRTSKAHAGQYTKAYQKHCAVATLATLEQQGALLLANLKRKPRLNFDQKRLVGILEECCTPPVPKRKRERL